MKIKGLNECDIVNYKKPSMFIIFPKCSWKCEHECGKQICQNNSLANEKDFDINNDELIRRYINNTMTSAIVCGGLEPFDTWEQLQDMVHNFRLFTTDDIVIYTGYYKEEISDKIEWLKKYPNIIIKFGRFVPDKPMKYDDVLGITLASDNQYAEAIS